MLLTLVAEQLKQGINSMILSVGEAGLADKAIEREAHRLGLPITPWRMKAGMNLKGAAEITRWAQKNSYDILHSHGYKFNILLALLPKSLKTEATVTTIHGYVNAKPFTKMWIYELLDKHTLRRMSKVVLVNGEMAKFSPFKNLPKEMLAVIPNGISLAPSDGKDDKNIREDVQVFARRFDFKLIAIGRLSPEKGLGQALNALSHLVVKGGMDIGLCIMGEGRLRDSLKAMSCELGIEDRVLFTGYTENASAHLALFDCLIMPSLTEGLPITLLEAMAARTPVIASSVGGIPTALDDGKYGVLVTPGNQRQLHDAIKDVKTNFAMAKAKAVLAREFVENVYSDKAMTSAYLDMYSSLLKIDRQEENL